MVRRLLAALLVVVPALMATLPAVDGSFLYDDHHYVLDNPAVVGEGALLTSPLGEPSQALWRPLTVASFRAQWEPGASARRFLAVNVGLHVLASLLVLWLARCLGAGRGAAVLAAVLFGVHPVHAEAVAWVTGRAELLAAVLVLGAWIAHLAPHRLAAWGAALLLTLACLAKENALAAPAAFALADLALGRRPRPWGRLALLAACALAVFAGRSAVLPEALPTGGPFVDADLGARSVVALNVVGLALRLLAWPHPLRIEYHRDELALARPDALLLVAALGLAVLLLWRRHPKIATSLVLTPLLLATVLHIVPIGEPFAERFLYLPSVPFCVAAGALLARWCRSEASSPRGLRPAALVTSGLVLTGLCACRSAVAVFHDELSLWTQAVAAAPDLALPHYNLGRQLDDLGRHVAQDRDRPGCRDELQTSLAIEPRHAYAAFAHHMLGNHDLGAVGRDTPNLRSAAEHFRAAIERLPELAVARVNLATVALRAPALVGADEALAVLQPLLSARDLDPDLRSAAEDLARQLSVGSGTGSAPAGSAESTGSAAAGAPGKSSSDGS